MAPIGDQDLDQLNSPFHKNLMGNVDSLVQHLEEMVAILDDQEGGGRDDPVARESLWNETTGNVSTVLGGLQAFVTGLRFEYSSLEREAEELDDVKKALEVERDDTIEKSHELHCRIQYNALEMKLDQSFGDIERCSSVESARCFKDEAHENLRRTREIIRTANLRNCRLDKEIFNEMERITTTFQEYQKDRETYVAELDLFDDVRRRKISSWMKDSGRTSTEQELAEGMIEFLDLSASRRHLEPKIISNTLRMQSMNESLAFDRHDNRKRLDEMLSLQKRVDDMSGLNNILPRKTPAATDLAATNDEGVTSSQQPFSEVDVRSDFLDGLDDHHMTSGNGLHRCPRKINLATDPITDPELQQELESALRWEDHDGLEQSTLDAVGVEATAEETARTGAIIAAAIGGDHTTDGGTPTTTSEDLQDPISTISRRSESMQENEEVENVGQSTASLCGDALLSQEKLAPADNLPVGSPHHHHHPPNAQTVTNTNNATETPMPRISHLLLHQVESATGVIGPSCQQKLMLGLIKKKSGGGPSSMTAIADGEREAASRITSLSHRLAAADDRETRSQGWQTGGGRVGGSGTGSNSGNPRN